MAIQVGEKIPDVTLKTIGSEGMRDISTGEIFSGGRVVLFAVPGAFTPVCSAKHLPGFVEKAAAIRAKGIDRIVCVSVNDAFVMDAWGVQAGAGDKVLMVADDGVVAKLAVEKPMQFEVSSAEAVLGSL